MNVGEVKFGKRDLIQKPNQSQKCPLPPARRFKSGSQSHALAKYIVAALSKYL
jgi:hypothetical protein